jgi:YVTN family beta-propeller protein
MPMPMPMALRLLLVVSTWFGLCSGFARAAPLFLPTGQLLTPTAAPDSFYQRLRTGLRVDGNADVNGAVSTALSPDGTALLVLSSGYDSYFSDTSGQPIVHVVPDPITGRPSTTTTPNAQWIFVYDVTGREPIVRQRINVPNTYCGLTWSSDGRHFLVSAGSDDRVYAFGATGSKARNAANQTYALEVPEFLLYHNSAATAPIPNYDGGLLKGTVAGGALGNAQYLTYGFGAIAAGIGMSRNERTLFAANLENDSLSIVDTRTRRVKDVHFFVPGGTLAIGEFPFGVAVLSGADGYARKVYASSLRDGQILSVDPATGTFVPIVVGGEPNSLLLSRDGRTLYVANGDDDSIDVIDTRSDRLARVISVLRPGYPYKGANPNGLALNPDGRTLYVTLGGENALAVIDLASATVRGRIPTGWEPSSVAVSSDGSRLYVVNTRSQSGPSDYEIDQQDNPIAQPGGASGYVYSLEKAGLLSLPVPRARALAELSRVVDRNNGFGANQASPLMAYLQPRIHHVIYVMRENRTYDQILGDLGRGNGDPRFAEFPWPVTPNAHKLATEFVDFDNFYDSGDVSGDGWNWTMQGHANDYTDKSVPVSYGNGGFTFDWNGSPRNLNVSVPEFGTHPSIQYERTTTLLDPSGRSNIEPGPKDIAATEGDSDDRPEALGGYIWDSVLRTGKTHRHYGAYEDEIYYNEGAPLYLPIYRDAWRRRKLQAVPLRPSLHGRTDPYYRGWDLNTPDVYRFDEWRREFDGFVRNGKLPDFEVLVLMMDHFGNFGTNVGGESTANTQIADNDYALGKLVETVSHSPYWKDTAIFVIEDDAQDGPDHVDSHRSVAFVISAYTKRHAVVSTPYTTVSMLRTIEDLLGARPLGLNDANTGPMDDAFQASADLHPYDAVVPGNLCVPPVVPNLIPDCGNAKVARTEPLAERHSPAWWAAQTKGFDFRGPDRIDSAKFNRVLWRGQMGDASLPPR